MSHRRRRPIVALMLAGILATAACGNDQGFESAESLTESFFGDAFSLRSGGDFGIDRVSSTDPAEGAPVEQALRVEFPAGSASQEVSREDGAPEGGAQLYLRLASGPTDAARLRYSVYFPEGFDFVKGGKLPGLYGGDHTSGGETPDGTDGFSTRYMWRAEGAGEVYAYLPSSDEVGTSLGRGEWEFPTGRWFTLEQEVRLNTPGEDDGVIAVSLDGEEVFRDDEVVFRTSDDLQIEGLFFSTFFGGGDPSWASPTDQYVEFGGFAVEPVS